MSNKDLNRAVWTLAVRKTVQAMENRLDMNRRITFWVLFIST